MSLAPATLIGNENNLRVSYGDDKGLLVEFEDDAVYQEFESKAQGRAIFKQVPFIRIIIPGDKTKQRYKPATEMDKVRFPQQWVAYERKEHAYGEGTPITEWIYLSKSQALELKHMGFFTVEILASASDTQISQIIGGNLLRTQAQDFIKGNTKVTNENEALRKEIADMKAERDAEMAAMRAEIEALKAQPVTEVKNKGGRPKKAQPVTEEEN